MKYLVERVEALEEQHGASGELIEILLELAQAIGEENGRNVSRLKKKIRALKRDQPNDSQRRLK